MNPKIMRGILKKLKVKRGCTANDFADLVPPSVYSTDPPPLGGGLGEEDTSISRNELYYLTDDLRQLAQWNIIDAFKNDQQPVKPDEITNRNILHLTFYLSRFAAQLEDVLEVSLTSSPIFGMPSHLSAWPDLFMLMPFTPQMKPIFDDHVKKVAVDLGLSAARGDDFFSRGSIVQDIWSAIYYAKVIVADCTKRNPNVFYEIGIAHTLGKETILISQTIKDIPFDLRHLRTIVYEYTPKGMAEFEEKLKSTLKTLS